MLKYDISTYTSVSHTHPCPFTPSIRLYFVRK